MFHQPIATFIKESIVESSARCNAGELILTLGLGNEASLYIQTDSPLQFSRLILSQLNP